VSHTCVDHGGLNWRLKSEYFALGISLVFPGLYDSLGTLVPLASQRVLTVVTALDGGIAWDA
jgi:hypothetical protein